MFSLLLLHSQLIQLRILRPNNRKGLKGFVVLVKQSPRPWEAIECRAMVINIQPAKRLLAYHSNRTNLTPEFIQGNSSFSRGIGGGYNCPPHSPLLFFLEYYFFIARTIGSFLFV